MNKIVNGVANDYEFNDIGYYQEINIPARQIGKTYQVINMYEQKYKQLQYNWNSLREWLEEEYKKYDIGTKTYGQAQVKETLNKMNELEGVNNERKRNNNTTK